MAPTHCKTCGSENLIDDGGETICAGCGTVVAEHRETNHPEFMETAGGGHSLVGQLFNESGVPQRRGFGGGGGESSEAVKERGRKVAQHIISGLRITQTNILDRTHSFFLLAVNKGFNKGRSTRVLISCCIYLTCRMNTPKPLPYMLIDFSEFLRINVFVLGHTFLDLCKKLNLELPLIDPSLFIPRFASQLKFSDKEHAVVNTAIRIVARMKRDWIVYGRRPSGVCGAGLLIASYLHECRKSQKEIIKVVKISDKTLQKRLLEFENVPSADLTPAEFEAIDFEHFEESDPPAFTRAREAEKKQLQVPSLEDIESSIINYFGEDIPKEDLIRLSLIRRKNYEEIVNPPSKLRRFENEEFSDAVIGSDEIGSVNGEEEEEEEEEEEDGEEEEEEEDGDELEDEEEEGEETLSDLDDNEINQYVCTPEEQKIKSVIWEKLHADYLKEKAEKEKQQAEDANNGVKPRKVTRKRKTPSSSSSSTTAREHEGFESVKSALEKRISTKINYNALNGLLTRDITANSLPTRLVA